MSESDFFLCIALGSLKKVYNELNYTNINSLTLASNIINLCVDENKLNVRVSKTGENEILLYTEKNNVFNNIIIDDECDMFYIRIGDKLGQEKSKCLNDKDLNYIVSLL